MAWRCGERTNFEWNVQYTPFSFLRRSVCVNASFSDWFLILRNSIVNIKQYGCKLLRFSNKMLVVVMYNTVMCDTKPIKNHKNINKNTCLVFSWRVTSLWIIFILVTSFYCCGLITVTIFAVCNKKQLVSTFTGLIDI